MLLFNEKKINGNTIYTEKNVKKNKNEENWLTTSNAKSYKLADIANIFS